MAVMTQCYKMLQGPFRVGFSWVYQFSINFLELIPSTRSSLGIQTPAVLFRYGCYTSCAATY